MWRSMIGGSDECVRMVVVPDDDNSAYTGCHCLRVKALIVKFSLRMPLTSTLTSEFTGPFNRSIPHGVDEDCEPF